VLPWTIHASSWRFFELVDVTNRRIGARVGECRPKDQAVFQQGASSIVVVTRTKSDYSEFVSMR
jgi:hypothetical protein